jgi:membrane-associated phospholipid phosphatase
MQSAPDPYVTPVLAAREQGPGSRFARGMDGRHPVLVFLAAVLSGMAMLVAVSIGLGLLVTDVLVRGGGGPDNAFVRTLADHRTGFETDLSAIGSTIGGAPVLPILVGLVALVAAVMRHWRVAAFAIFVLALESATYRITSIVVPRDRPHVHRLEGLPADASFPSGHTAASIAVYAGLVLLLTSRIRDGRVRVLAWMLAIALPIFVALSRMYRGMHHPLDVAGGAVIGISAICILVFACRAAGVAASRRAQLPQTERDGRFARTARTTVTTS